MLLCAAVVLLPLHAFADTSPSAATSGATLGQTNDGEPTRFSDVRFEIHGDFGWYGGVGVGARLEFSVAHDVVRGVGNDIALSFGAELFYFYNPNYSGIGVYPIAAAQWNFYVSRRVSLFPELGVAFLFGPYRERYWGTFIAPYLGLGLRFHFNDRNALLVRVSWPAGLQLGITF